MTILKITGIGLQKYSNLLCELTIENLYTHSLRPNVHTYYNFISISVITNIIMTTVSHIVLMEFRSVCNTHNVFVKNVYKRSNTFVSLCIQDHPVYQHRDLYHSYRSNKKKKMRWTVANQLLINSTDSKMPHVTRPLVKLYFSVTTGNRISFDAIRVSVLEMLQRPVHRPLSQRNATVFCFPERRKHISLSAPDYARLMRLMLAASWHLHALEIRWNYSPIISDKLQRHGKFVQ